MARNFLERILEYNNWANLLIIQACSSLSDEQLDTPPQTATKGDIRTTLLHMIEAQQNYLGELAPIGAQYEPVPVTVETVEEVAARTGEQLVKLARQWEDSTADKPIKTRDSLYTVEPWLVMVQAINHAMEHREQIKSMLTSLGLTPPRIDGWDYGRAEDALIRIE